MVSSDTSVENLKELSMALAKTTDEALVYDFLLSLLTQVECDELAMRWALVKKLDKGVSQRQIAKELGLSLCKITRGSKELKKDDSAFRKMIENIPFN